MSKLQNIKAIKQMMDGSHRMQTRQTVSNHISENSKLTSQKAYAKKGDVIYEEFKDDKGNITGYKTHFKVGDNSWIQVYGKYESYETYEKEQAELRALLDPFNKCEPNEVEDCIKNTKDISQADRKIARRTRKCLACAQREESRYRYQGGTAYRDWVREKLKANAESMLRDEYEELQHFIKSLDKENHGINADGKVIERYTMPEEQKQQLIEKLLTEFEAYRKWVLAEEQENEVN